MDPLRTECKLKTLSPEKLLIRRTKKSDRQMLGARGPMFKKPQCKDFTT